LLVSAFAISIGSGMTEQITTWWHANPGTFGEARGWITGLALIYFGVASFAIAERLVFELCRPIGHKVLDRLAASPEPSPLSERDLVAIHWSDIHLTESPQALRLDGGRSPNNTWEKVIARASSITPAPDLILMTGDQTNAGQASEWSAFFSTINGLPPELRSKLVILPGNHDLNLPHPTDVVSSEGTSNVLARARMLRMIAAIDCVQGDRAWILADGLTRKEDKIVRVRDFIDTYRSEFGLFFQNPPQLVQRQKITHWPGAGVTSAWVDATPPEINQRFHRPEHVFQALFPMVIEEPRTQQLVYVLDSNAVGGNVVDNAFGQIRWDHLILLRRLQAHFGRRPSIYLLHHHVALPPLLGAELRTKANGFRPHLKKLSNALLRRFMVLRNASEFLAALPGDREAIIFHGHRHTGFEGQLGPGIQIISAPSTTLGDEHPDRQANRPGFSVWGIRETQSNGTQVAWRKWMEA